MLKKVETKLGVIYYEDFSKRAEEDRWKFFDSTRGYMDYFPFDFDEEFTEEMANDFIEGLKEITDIKVLLETLCVDYLKCFNKVTDRKALTEYLIDEGYEDDWENNEWVNHIGDYVIFVG